jgi:hypothetical protein
MIETISTSEGGENMKKKILMITVTLLAISIFAFPLTYATQPTVKSIEYFRNVENRISTDWRFSGKSQFMVIVKESVRTGSIYEGTDVSGTKLFDFTQWGSCEQNYKLGKAQWHFYMDWIKDSDSGFRGKLNGDASGSTYMEMETYTVSGVLQGYGEFKGQKLMIEMVRIPPDNAQITGLKITN